MTKAEGEKEETCNQNKQVFQITESSWFVTSPEPLGNGPSFTPSYLASLKGHIKPCVSVTRGTDTSLF